VIRLLVWLANHLSARGAGLSAGQFVTTGSCTGMMFTKPGSHVRSELPGLGVVEVTFER
jgi:2-keto-4-pentenoate hydratase